MSTERKVGNDLLFKIIEDTFNEIYKETENHSEKNEESVENTFKIDQNSYKMLGGISKISLCVRTF